MKTVRVFSIALSLLLLAVSSLWAITEEDEYNIAWQYCQAGKYPQAVEAYQKFLKHHPRGKLLAEAHFTLARIENSGTNSFSHYQFIIDNYPAHALAAQAAFATAQYCQNAGAFSDAKARYLFTYSRYAQTPPGSESLYRLALMALAAESLTQAASYAQAFVQQYPQNFRGAAIARSLADGWRLKSDSAQANYYWRQILELYPESYEAGEAREQLLSGIEDSPEVQDDSLPQSLPAPAPANPVIKSPPVKISTPVPKLEAGKKYYLQIGVYREKAVMADWKKRLEKQDHQCRVDSSGGKKDRSYRLYAGPYSGKEQAQKISQKLLSAYGIKTMLVQK
ncbi:MAG: tetratricopeptide repeat protein [bacterium]|nr:tetratricopeptide repeat protein [bacterium]